MTTTGEFRKFLPGPDHPPVRGIETQDAYSHGDLAHSPPINEILEVMPKKLLAEPFKGITCDGKVHKNLFVLEPNGAPVEAMTEAARAILAVATPDELRKISQPIDSEQWRKWSNPEFYVFRDTLRLEEHGEPIRAAILDLLAASMSPKGFEKAINCMRINHFLGELVNARKVMNEYSYNFCLFGEPSLTAPWGWQYFGHHLCLHCFVVGKSMTISPMFMGAEPNEIDVGPFAGTTIFRDEERVGLQLMQSLPRDQKDRAQIYKSMKDPAMPPGRWIFSDQRHLGGAFQDNRIIPYEGVLASEMGKAQQRTLLDLVGAFIEYLPPGPLAARLSEVERHIGETYFSWIGRHGDNDIYYYRIQSPVIMVEFDHHSGVFLCNVEPERFHIHTLVRTPNGNDYGKDWLRAYNADRDPARNPKSVRVA
ncbi:MAG: DUF3500 domain-containing protein [Xanthobacteraceae bacterium]